MIFHARRNAVHSLDDVIELIDRFLDDALQYDLEWDDFISWDNDNLPVEQIRDEIAGLELLFFKTEDRLDAVNKLIAIRNRLAGLRGKPLRECLHALRELNPK